MSDVDLRSHEAERRAIEREQQILLEQIRSAQMVACAERAREHLIPFVQFLQPDPECPDDPRESLYRPSIHHEVIAEALEDVAQGRCLRLILSVPPQHGKSELSTRNLPAWIIGKMPHKHVVVGAYNDDFAMKFGTEVRSVIENERYSLVFPRVKLDNSKRASDFMRTNARGDLLFRGRGSGLTGNPADVVIIDDPIKDAKEAESLTIRNDCWEWFTKVVFSRCHSLTSIVIIMTRWHEDDIVGRLTDPRNPHYNAEEAEKWTYINIPAIIDTPEMAKALKKKVGDALWPERFPIHHLQSAKNMNPTGFSALYQGRPTPPEGSYFKRDQLVGYARDELRSKDFRYYLSADLAVSPEVKRDKSCVGVWGIDENDVFYLLPELYWERRSSDQSVDKILELGERYHVMTMFSEKGQIDKSLRPFLEKQMRANGKWFNIEAMSRPGNKGSCAVSIRGFMAAGQVRFPKFAPWWPAAEDELLKFTGSGDDTHDDFCDMLANFGMGISKTIKAAKSPQASNVIQIGTMRWVREQSDRQRKQERALRALKGF